MKQNLKNLKTCSKTSQRSSIYTNVYEVIDRYYPNLVFFYFQGGRGKGKTYSTLKESLNRITPENKLFYVRRTDRQIKACTKAISNPFKAINKKENKNIIMKTTEDLSLILDISDEDKPELLGYGGSLSTFGNMRGADFSDVGIIFFDEWINLSPVNTLKDEAYLFFNLYETIARNREMESEKPPLCIFCSNAETINDNMIRTLKLSKPIMEIATSEKEYGVYIDEDRLLYYEMLPNDGEFEKKKKETALYKLTKGTRYFDMAVENNFTKDFFGDIKRYRLNEFNPYVAYENVYFYVHKAGGWLYATYRKCNCPHYYERTMKQFKRDYGYRFMQEVEGGTIRYMNYDVKMDVINIF